MIILDAHCDAPSQMYRLRDYSQDNHHSQVDFPKMRRGGVWASFFALYIPARLSEPDARKYCYDLFDVLDRQVKANAETVHFAASAAQVKENYDKGLISILIGLENGSPIGHDINILHDLYAKGVRYVTLTHSADNQICDSCTGKGTWGGLSPFGRDLIHEMNNLGMLIDLAHCSDATVAQTVKLSQKPVVFTHGCCRALSNHRRNLPDNLLKGIADTGGVIGMSIYPQFLSESFVRIYNDSHLEDMMYLEDRFIANPADAAAKAAWDELQDQLIALPRPTASLVVDHIDHAVKVAGIEHVGIGTDYDGIAVMPQGMEDISKLHLIFDEMHRRGYSDDDIERVASGNFLRLLQ